MTEQRKYEHTPTTTTTANGLFRDKPDSRRGDLFSKCSSHSKCAIHEIKQALDSLHSSEEGPLLMHDVMGAEKHIQKSLEILLASGAKSQSLTSDLETEAVQTINAVENDVKSFTAEKSNETTKWLNSSHHSQKPYFQHFNDPDQYYRRKYPQGLVLDETDYSNAPELAHVFDWEKFDIFALQEQTNGRALTALAIYLFNYFNLFKDLELDETKVLRYWLQVEGGYQDIPYHNSIHAADVLRALAWFFNIPFVRKTLTPLEICAGLVSAGIHDHDHPGLNNGHLIRTRHQIAVRYNDKSVLENHHASSGLQILHAIHQNNFLSHFDKKTLINFRRIVTTMVLATDMAFHFQLQGDFEKLGTNQEKVNLNEPATRDLLLQQLLHAADLANCGQPWKLAHKWGLLVVQEFFSQGDIEKSLKLEVAPMNDREKSTAAGLQHGFIEAICSPMFRVMTGLLPDINTLADHCVDNAAKWKEVIEKEKNEKSAK